MIKKILITVILACSIVSAQDEEEFEDQENGLYELNSISFNGNSQLSSSDLADAIYSQETPGWFWQFLDSFTSFGNEPIYFDSSSIEIDLNALKSFYSAHGFFKASFSKFSVSIFLS